jgi:hypothetical protein
MHKFPIIVLSSFRAFETLQGRPADLKLAKLPKLIHHFNRLQPAVPLHKFGNQLHPFLLLLHKEQSVEDDRLSEGNGQNGLDQNLGGRSGIASDCVRSLPAD